MSGFQSHAGSVEATTHTNSSQTAHSSFNPTLVRLRPPEKASSPSSLSWFQSHAGSIEARGGRRFPAPRCRFNPTLVRLRPFQSSFRSSMPAGFNPTLVRLRPCLPDAGCRPADRFQSHAGSIEALVAEGGGHQQDLRFNPTLVRLRLGGGLPAAGGGGVRFQSHAGSIEALKTISLSPKGRYRFNPTLVRLRQVQEEPSPSKRGTCFNPTLVRLRPPPPLPRPSPGKAFQSHAGSIEARPAAPAGGEGAGFQSHAGSIEAV